ncbi:glycosyltransferase [Mediterraneibacter gnavus]|uniref:glycosyltransferase n=1 Tax=Mediterraneibacter gnavus TaxID=33038 RepID=UPI002AEE0E52|nr:glycosyltransferase [Mediterraneibacter gnavus]
MKCLFVVSDFEVGGITSSLKNITKELIQRGHEVSILNLPKADSLPMGFDKRVNLLELDKRSKFWNFGIYSIFEKNLCGKCSGLIIGLIKKILNKLNLWNRWVFEKLNIEEKYDIAIGFRQGPVDYYVARYKVNADIHVGFWHGDPDHMGDMSSWDSCISKMDIIAGVSDATCESLLRHYPILKGKLQTVYNIFDVDAIKMNAKKEKNLYNTKTFNIVTVSRIDFFNPKNHQRIPEICKLLVQDNIKFHWTIVGDGPDREKLQAMIEQHNLMDTISLIGVKSNPYPYIKEADLFVLTSTWESYGMVVMESLILGTPVVAGDYPALKEILPNTCGIRADNSVDGIYSAIKKAITDVLFYQEIKKNSLKFTYSTDETYRQFLGLSGDKDA